jgi:5'-3' exonuclease
VRGDRVVQLERRTNKLIDEAGVLEKFGVLPASIPGYLALVGDSADGFPGLPGWGARSAAAVLQRYGSLDAIPADASQWEVPVRGADKLALVLREQMHLARLFRDLATLQTYAPVFDDISELQWQRPTPEFAAFCERIEGPQLLERANALARRRA